METIGRDAIIARVIDTFEGGFVNNPSDPGGATNMGITLETLQRVRPGATVNTVKTLSKIDAIAIYKELYWTQFHIESMPVDVQDVVFDSYVQYSPHTAGTLIQKSLTILGQNVAIDGIIGDNTINAMQKVSAKELRKTILSTRKTYYENLAASHPSQGQFLNGWLRRLEALA